MDDNFFMKIANNQALKGMIKGDGGPFGAVIVNSNTGKVIAKSHNKVLSSNDPTNHAEMVAIRLACKKLGRFDLSDCVIYSSCEPCPMCFSAIHWAKISKLYYGCTRNDASNIGFDDKFIYDVIKGSAKDNLKSLNLGREDALKVFEEFKKKDDKKMY